MEKCLYVYWKGLEIVGNLPIYASHTVCNQQVRGSSPFTSSIVNGFAVHLNSDAFPSGQRGQTVNLLRFRFGGPNPPASTTNIVVCNMLYCTFFCSELKSSRQYIRETLIKKLF